jgi:hypothetical protein
MLKGYNHMNLNSTVKTVLAVAAIGAVPAISFGQVSAPNSSTGSNLVVQVWDPTTHIGLIEILSNTYSSFLPGGPDGATQASGFSLGVQLDTSSSAFINLFNASSNTNFGTNPTPASLDFNVLAMYQPASPGVNSLITTGPNNTTGTSRTGASINSSLGTFETQFGDVFQGTTPYCAVSAFPTACIATGSSSDNNTTFLTQVGASNFNGSVGTVANTGTTLSTSAALGMWEYTYSSATASTRTVYQNSTGLGQWTLNSEGDLVYTIAGAAATVPLPAAAWLFGSGLLGLFGIGRRRVSRA